VDPVYVSLIAIVALLVGLAVGWFLATRSGGGREEFKRAVRELADANIENATLKANADNFDKQLELMRQARET
jgi:DNA recombination protein RmuC